jgi:hypothetical protein
MKYDGGYLHKHVRWVKLDKRNRLYSRYSHRISARDMGQIHKLHGYFTSNYDSYTSSWWGDNAPQIYRQCETMFHHNFYLNEEELVKLIIGYVE